MPQSLYFETMMGPMVPSRGKGRSGFDPMQNPARFKVN